MSEVNLAAGSVFVAGHRGLVGSALVLSVVVALLAVALLRRRGTAPAERSRAGGGVWVVSVGGIALPLFVLAGLFVATLRTMPATRTVEVAGSSAARTMTPSISEMERTAIVVRRWAITSRSSLRVESFLVRLWQGLAGLHQIVDPKTLIRDE